MKQSTEHGWNIPPSAAVEIQRRLAGRLSSRPPFDALTDVKSVAGCDVSFRPGRVAAAVVVMSFPDLRVEREMRRETSDRDLFPYIPSLFAFREGPLLSELLRSLEPSPEVVIFDGQGIAHPRRLGLAAHLGMLFDCPAIGCAKSRLFGRYRSPGKRKGARAPLWDKEGEEIGVVLRTRTGVKPVFVSPGHRMDSATAAEIVLRCCRKFRLPEPLRAAHALCSGDKKKDAG